MGLEKNTLVIFSSDNGAAYTGSVDTQWFNSGGGLRGLKGSVYEGGIRVPSIAYWPVVIRTRSESSHVSAMWNMAPTLVDIPGARPPTHIDGISFASTLRGDEPQAQHRSLYWEYHDLGGMQATRFSDDKGDGLPWKAIRNTTTENPSGKVERYHLDSDPGERLDAADKHPRVRGLAQTLLKQQRLESPVEPWNFH